MCVCVGMAGIRQVNHELGGIPGEEAAQQELLRAASRWLGGVSRVRKLMASLEQTKPDAGYAHR